MELTASRDVLHPPSAIAASSTRPDRPIVRTFPSLPDVPGLAARSVPASAAIVKPDSAAASRRGAHDAHRVCASGRLRPAERAPITCASPFSPSVPEAALFEETREGEILVVRPKVRQLNVTVAPQLRSHMEGRIREGHRRIILHLGDVDFVDSTALGAIVAALKALDSRGHLMLCGARDTVRAMLEVTRMDRVLRTFDDEPAAKDAMLRAAG